MTFAFRLVEFWVFVSFTLYFWKKGTVVPCVEWMQSELKPNIRAVVWNLTRLTKLWWPSLDRKYQTNSDLATRWLSLDPVDPGTPSWPGDRILPGWSCGFNPSLLFVKLTFFQNDHFEGWIICTPRRVLLFLPGALYYFHTLLLLLG